MSAFASLILFIIIAIGSMAVVAYTNYKVEKTKKVREQLQKYKVRVEELEDIVLAIDQVCETRMISKLINDEVIEVYETMISLDPNAGYLQAGLANANIRAEELSNESADRNLSRLCNSDAQIARMRAYLNEACKTIRKQHAQNKISPSELQTFILELEWLHLQVSVISSIVQGHKAYNKQDILTANAFYKKAQTELMQSGHPDERKHTMIKQLADVLFGRRYSLDKELMPEDEFNPESVMENKEKINNDLSEEALLQMSQENLFANLSPTNSNDSPPSP